MKVTLYHGADAFEADLHMDEETGEIGTGVDLDVLVKQNPVGTIAHIQTNKATVEMLKAAEVRLAKRRKLIEAHNERVAAALKGVMQATGTLKVTSDDRTLGATLSREANVSVDVFEPRLLPAEYQRVIPATVEPNKVAIKDALKAGVDVPGARLVYEDRLTIK